MERVTGLPALLIDRRLRRTFVGGVVLVLSLVAPTSSLVANATSRSHAAAACSAAADAVSGASTSDQLVTVVAATSRSQHATLDFFVRLGGLLPAGRRARTRRSSGATASRPITIEGDDTTPLGLFGFQSTMYGVDPDPGVAYRYHRLVCGDWWDEQSSSPLYNHFVHVPCGTAPDFGGGSEALWQTVPSYDYFAVIAYNRHPIVPGKGSAIFLHVSDGQPTAGCVSIPVTDLLRVLRALRANLHPLIDIAVR